MTPNLTRPTYSEIEGASGWPGRLTCGTGCVVTQPLVDLLSSARQGVVALTSWRCVADREKSEAIYIGITTITSAMNSEFRGRQRGPETRWRIV
jgi:hypothetical protein